MTRYWVAVASADHVRRGQAGGFMQLGHGREAPLRRLKPGDRIAYYSPTGSFGGKDRLQAFIAIGTVAGGDPYRGDTGLWRRDVAWAQASPAPIAPLVDRLEFAAGGSNWGYRLRFGLISVSAQDFALIAAAMGLPNGAAAGDKG
jgi:hypothetical protein